MSTKLKFYFKDGIQVEEVWEYSLKESEKELIDGLKNKEKEIFNTIVSDKKSRVMNLDFLIYVDLEEIEENEEQW